MPQLNKKTLKEHVGNGKVLQVLEEILNALPETDSMFNDFMHLKSQWVTAEKKSNLRLESNSENEITKNRIINTILT